MYPEVIEAMPKLVEQGILPADRAPRLLRIARRELVSVYFELRLLMYGGVLLITAGIGLLLKENLDQTGPWPIAVMIGLAAAAALFYVARTSPPFSWGEIASPNPAFDYLLLLGTLLIASELTWIELRYAALGMNWPWHLLLVALIAALLAIRYDSRMVFSLALTSFASWAGVVASPIERGFWRDSLGTLRLRTIACGVIFILLAQLLKQARKKLHFEPVAAHLGWLLLLAALFSGAWLEDSALYSLALLACSAGLTLYSYRNRLFSFFTMGAIGLYLGLGHLGFLGFRASHLGYWFWESLCIVTWYAALAFAALFASIRIYNKMREPL
jgi:hypothetical protein